MNKFTEFDLLGTVEVTEPMTDDEFLDIFIEWVESKGWTFGGGVAVSNTPKDSVFVTGLSISEITPLAK